jgi:uncharacterized protein YndB with AHSA1/START domain
LSGNYPGSVLNMAEKKKFTLEYEVRSSPRILYSFISEPNGLSQWFADDVNFRDQVYTFTWDDEQQKAKLVAVKENKLVKFKWLDDEPQCYFEMEIVQDELTNDVALSITDFTTDELLAEKKLIWDNQIDYLISVLGA